MGLHVGGFIVWRGVLVAREPASRSVDKTSLSASRNADRLRNGLLRSVGARCLRVACPGPAAAHGCRSLAQVLWLAYGSARQAARSSETAIAFAGAGRASTETVIAFAGAGRALMKPLSPLRVPAEPRLKPSSPLRVRNGCFWCIFRLQWCCRFQWSLFGGEQWCRRFHAGLHQWLQRGYWFQRRHVVAPRARKSSPCSA